MTGPRPAAGLIVEVLDGEAVVWDPVHEALHRLDRVATEVLARLDGSPVEDLVSGLARDFAAPVEVVGPDVARLLEQLRVQHLLEA